ncbi:nuclear transport factor 2 family protein [Winogradskyella haliclonae]|uniref:SnoaL-like domain-containing protein n=1 Tax=Winogradskyella haliclonae TaxID=2048558 RepID=A0ABQ2BXU7_9FLAO|nr:nuclear transport factor 2 family protein [Winogradskyella haliclonae]GGI57306.1 hypothetical protein GCM10011444_16150 [Winogradskyella haliclonae]
MEKLVTSFYTAFANLDAEAMANCYHKDIVFEDPAFGVLHGEHAKNMWRMLCASQKGKDFIVTFSNIEINENIASAKWEAKYNFSKTRKRVHNKISAQFQFKDGLIIKHVDTFNLHRWASQAFGFKGKLIGGTSFFKKKLQKQTHTLLSQYETKN